MRYLIFLVFAISVSEYSFAAGYFNPEVDKKTYKNVMIIVPVQDLKFREEMEKEFIGYMRKYSESTCKKSLELFPPFFDSKPDDFIRLVKRNDIDAVISIEPSNKNGSYPPVYRHESDTFAMKYVSSRHNRRINANVTLYDTQLEKPVWTLPVSFTDDGDDVIEGVAERTVKHLRSAQLIIVKEKKKRSWFSNSESKKPETVTNP